MITNKTITLMLKKKYLSSKDITAYVMKYQRARSAAKKEEYKDIVFQNISRFIAKSVSKHGSSKIDPEDLFQAGVVGFCEALEKFNGSMGYMFITYLKFWVDKSMYNTLYANNLIHTPRHVINDTCKKQRLEVSGKKVKYNKFSEAFMNTANLVNLDNTDNFDLSNLLRSPISVEVDIERSMLKHDVMNVMNNHLDNREIDILKMRYFGDEHRTLQEVGKVMSLSTERIRQIENKAIRKLRRHI